MNQPIAVYHGKNLLLLGLLAVGGFSVGLFLQSGWNDVKPMAPQETIQEFTPVVRAKPDQNNLQSLRLERDREQSRQRERLGAMAAGNDPGSELAKQTTGELLELERRIAKELELEQLLSVRGYPENMVTISETTVTVAIGGQRLSPENVAAIGEWTAEISGRPINQVRIVDQSMK